MIDPGSEIDLSWLEGIVSWEVDVEEVNTSGIGRVIRSNNGSLPVVWVLLIDWTGGAVSWWVFSEIDELFLNSLDCRHYNLRKLIIFFANHRRV